MSGFVPLSCIFIGFLALFLAFSFHLASNYNFLFNPDIVQYNVNSNKVIFETSDKFLSVALDTSFMWCSFHKLNEREWDKLRKLSSLLSPGYLRLGGTDADKAFFSLDDSLSYIPQACPENKSNNSLIITGSDWIKINEFAKKAKLNFIFDLNVLRRSGNAWDSSNAEILIKFSQENKFRLDFQLGNEPNSFPHVFNITISGSQLARDFSHLRNILKGSGFYSGSKLIGPDVTRPKSFGIPSLDYLEDFLEYGVFVDAVSWHQYVAFNLRWISLAYLNAYISLEASKECQMNLLHPGTYYFDGRTATLFDFLNPDIFEVLPLQIKAVTELVRKFLPEVPVWISETSSAFGGGAPGLSDRFVACFLWLDKLGAAASSGISVVVRQSLFKGSYALISSNFEPSPNFWISFFFKNLVGEKVISIEPKHSGKNLRHLRLYSHCLASNSPVNGSLVIFGMNLSNETKMIVPSGVDFKHLILSYSFTPKNFNLKSRGIELNGKPLFYDSKTIHEVWKRGGSLELPLVAGSYSIFFWVFQEIKTSFCFQ